MAEIAEYVIARVGLRWQARPVCEWSDDREEWVENADTPQEALEALLARVRAEMAE